MGRIIMVLYMEALLLSVLTIRRISDENNRIIFYDISIWNNIYDNKQKV